MLDNFFTIRRGQRLPCRIRSGILLAVDGDGRRVVLVLLGEIMVMSMEINLVGPRKRDNFAVGTADADDFSR